jgi:hypothetical protein
MAPPQDFANAYNSNLSPNRAQQGERVFENQRQNSGEAGQGQGQVGEHNQQPQQHQHSRSNEEASYMRPMEYETAQKRKRSFTIPGTFESP